MGNIPKNLRNCLALSISCFTECFRICDNIQTLLVSPTTRRQAAPESASESPTSETSSSADNNDSSSRRIEHESTSASTLHSHTRVHSRPPERLLNLHSAVGVSAAWDWPLQSASGREKLHKWAESAGRQRFDADDSRQRSRDCNCRHEAARAACTRRPAQRARERRGGGRWSAAQRVGRAQRAERLHREPSARLVDSVPADA